jgi:uncharacterized membrane protein YidH (DUF202 family)
LTQSGVSRPGSLAAERTILAWTRTSFAFLVNGVLLTIKDWHGAKGLASLIPPTLAGAAALGSFLIALQRQRTLGQRPFPTRITARTPVCVVGVAALVLIVVTAVTQLV